MRICWNQDWEFKRNNGEWRTVTLPHDAMLEEKRTKDAEGKNASGYFLGGKYYYRKILTLNQEQAKKHYTLEFGGVYKNAKIWVNGLQIGGYVYGYSKFYVELGKTVREGENVIEVEADNQNQPDSRWYSGAGIYRSVYLWVQEDIRLIPDKIKIDTISISPACIRVQAEHVSGQIRVEVRDESNQSITETVGDDVQISVPDARLWDEFEPYLYQIVVQLCDREKVIEEQMIPYGIRKIERRADGLYINNKRTILKGGCIHHDNGILGAKEYKTSAYRKIKILKEAGFNAIRSAHNPCSEEILQACDLLGMYVIDETWDMWYNRKSSFDYSTEFMENYKNDIRSMVAKDYNHSSVIMYSIGNEVSEPATEEGVRFAEELVMRFHEADTGRLVTGGFNLMIIANAAKGNAIYDEEGGISEAQTMDFSNMDSTMFNMIAAGTGTGMNHSADGKEADALVSPVLDKLDIAGYNYASGRYAEDEKLHPDRLIIGTETFPQDLAQNWKTIVSSSNVIGDFMWTAWDYLGEAGLGAWSYDSDAMNFQKPFPWLLADTGVFDILGNPTGEALQTKVIFSRDFEHVVELAVTPCNHPDVQVIKAAWRGTNAIPSWSWSGCEGNKLNVEVYAKGSIAKLYLNDILVGEKEIENYKAEFSVAYQKGKLSAKIFNEDGSCIGEKTLRSCKEKIQTYIVPEQKSVYAGEIVYVDVYVGDDTGIVESNMDSLHEAEVENGELLAFGSANPRTEENYLEGRFTTYYGRAQVVVRAGKAGVTKIRVRSQQNEAIAEIEVKKNES